MLKYIKPIVISSVAILGISTISTNSCISVNASSIDTEQISTSQLSNRVVDISDRYINFNNRTNQFYVDDSLHQQLTSVEYQSVIVQVKNTNEQISLAISDDKDVNTDISVVDPNNGEMTLITQYGRAAGKTAIKFYWNYARIWIKAADLRNALQVGFAIGGVYAPTKAIIAAMSIAGIAANNIKNGIWFDYNYYAGSVLKAGQQ